MVERSKINFHGAWVAFCLSIILVAWAPDILRHYRNKALAKQFAPENFLTVERVDVGNSTVGGDVILDVERTVHRDFYGTYTVEVRTFPRREVVCIASDSLLYRTESNLPDPVTLAWWADSGECTGPNLTADEYVIVTTWVIHNNGIWPDQTVTIESNPFVVSTLSQTEAEQARDQILRLQEQVERLQQQIPSE